MANDMENKKNGKRKIIPYAIITALMLLVPVLLPVCAELFVPAQYKKTFSSELVDKVRLLESTSEPKIIVIGGSAVAFALDSELMGEKTGMKTVNFGLYASLGTRVMLELAKKHIGEGDIAVICPETDRQTMSAYFGAVTMWQATEEDRGILSSLPADMKRDMALHFWDYAADKCRLWTTGTPDPEGVYRRDSFNSLGDVVYERPQSRMPLGYDPSKIIDPSPDLPDPEFISLVNGFTAYAREKGAEVYFSFAPMNRAAVKKDVTDDTLYSYYLSLCSSLSCEVISDVSKSIMDPGYFYDSNFHLNDSGKTVWTANLTLDILRTQGRAVGLSLDLPEPPPLPEGAVIAEDDGTDVYFTFREIRNDAGEIQWYSVSGLSDEGKNEKELTLPYLHLGIPVHSIDRNAFYGAGKLESLVIRDNIYSIESGAFAGAPLLSALHILNEDESSMAVDQLSLFDGANRDIKIYLYSEKSYSSYVAGYFWANYGGKMILKSR
jgi:hypothetical protein